MSYKGIVATSGKSMLMAITLASIMSLPRAMFAATATVNGITWTYTVSNGEASLGGGTSSSPAILTSTTRAITIPSKLGGYPVTRIGRYAFSDCRGLTIVTIPDTVRYIGDNAFRNCSALRGVTIVRA